MEGVPGVVRNGCTGEHKDESEKSDERSSGE